MAVQLIASAVLLLLAAIGLRWRVGALWSRPPFWVIGLDLAPLVIGAALFAGLSARPLFAALVVTALAAGLALADSVKREVLQEPVVFSDRAELLEVVRHPEFYLPFAGTFVVLGGAVVALGVAGAVAWAVPPLWPWSPWPALAGLVLAGGALALPGWPPLLRRLARRYEALRPAREPAQDAAAWGLLASFAIHATIARAERPARRAAARAGTIVSDPVSRGPVVMAQLESFFDPRRLHPDLPSELLPGWDACVSDAIAWGRLAVPCWGANTIRTEFAALTGLTEDDLGLDRFNPYERFARERIDSVAWRMRAMGRQTMCLHPFDTRFYGRRHAMPALGFERFIGPEAFSAAERAGGHVSDAALARKAAEILAEAGPDVFLFVISIGNHGPWLADRGPEDAEPLAASLRDVPDAAALRRYLGGLRRTDRFLPLMTTALRDLGTGGMLLAYGDHQPSLPAAFAALGHDDTDCDYLLWDASERATTAPRRQHVEALSELLLHHMVVAEPAARSRRDVLA